MKELDNEKDKYVDGLMDRHRDKQIDKIGVQIHTSVDWGTPRCSARSTRLGAPSVAKPAMMPPTCAHAPILTPHWRARVRTRQGLS